MDTAPPAMSEHMTPPSARTSSVHMGRQDYLSVLLRLIGMELYKIRRRMMSKVLGIISALVTVGLFALIALVVFFISSDPRANVSAAPAPLHLPLSLYLIGQLLLSLGEVLIVILVSTIVGGEYSANTIRLMLTRGPTRTQLFCSKIGASIACIVLGVLGITLLGILTGELFNLIVGIGQNFAFFTTAWLGHALLYLLITMLALFVYATMALFLSTLGRATAAGIAGVLTWSFIVEPVISVIGTLGRSVSGPTGDFLQALPDYFISKNIGTLLQNQSSYLFGSQLSASNQGSDLHALLVLAVYLVLFIGFGWWIVVRRDVTN